MRSLILFITLSVNCQVVENRLSDVNSLTDGFYFGSDRLFNTVFVNIKGDTAFADFIFYQKYPRELFSDTLFYSSDQKKWIGKNTTLYESGGKNYASIKGIANFEAKKDTQIKHNDRYYHENIDEMKNLAVLHMCFNEYSKLFSDPAEANRKFNVLKTQSKLGQKQKHSQFLIALSEFKERLYRK